MKHTPEQMRETAAELAEPNFNCLALDKTIATMLRAGADAVERVSELEAQPQPAPVSEPIYRHEKTGGLYAYVTDALIEASQLPVVVYRSCRDGVHWIRPHAEFHDGRFALTTMKFEGFDASPTAPVAPAAVPVAWHVQAVAWLRGKAAEQAQNNERWPDHAKAYANWRDTVKFAERFADDLERENATPSPAVAASDVVDAESAAWVPDAYVAAKVAKFTKE